MAAATQITTGKVRFSYNNLFTPRAAQEGAQEKYSTTLLIPKSDKATVKKIKAATSGAIRSRRFPATGAIRPTRIGRGSSSANSWQNLIPKSVKP